MVGAIAAGDVSLGSAPWLLSTHLWRHKAVYDVSEALWRNTVLCERDIWTRMTTVIKSKTWQISLKESYLNYIRDDKSYEYNWWTFLQKIVWSNILYTPQFSRERGPHFNSVSNK